MKTFTHISKFLLLLILFAGMSSSVQAQTPEQGTMKKVIAAISSSNVGALSGFFHSTLEVTVPGQDNSFSDQQATFVLKEFFAKYKVTAVDVIHEGKSGSTYYATATTSTANGDFDTNIFLKPIGDSFKVTSIRFEAQ